MKPLVPLFMVAAALPPPEGTYLLELHQGTLGKVPILGEIKGGSRALLRVEIGRDAAGVLRHRQTTCKVSLGGAGDKARVRVGPQFVSSLAQREVVVDYGGEDGRYRVDLGVELLGFDGPLDWNLPVAITDPGVVDSDHDGHPGATIEVEVPLLGVVELYIAQRAHMRLEGNQGVDGVIRGKVEMPRFEQRTLAASHPMFESSPDLRPDPGRSHFVLRPVPPGSTCSEIVKLASVHDKVWN
jgi:hypothetical protein